MSKDLSLAISVMVQSVEQLQHALSSVRINNNTNECDVM